MKYQYLMLGLSFSLFLLFYSVFVGRFPEKESIKDWWLRKGFSFLSAAVFFFLGNFLYFSPLSGFFCSIFGWYAPRIYMEARERKQREKNREAVMDFISVASSMYGSNATTPKVMEECAKRLPDPFASEFDNITSVIEYGSYERSVPDLLVNVADRHKLPELKAAAQIIKRASTSGGAKAASEGLMNLSEAISKVNERRKERMKSTYDSLFAAKFVLYVLLLGLFLNATVFREINQQNPLVIGLGCGLVVGYYFLIQRIGRSDDITM